MEDNKKKDVDMTMETEVIKALKEEFEAKIASQKETYENTLTTMRQEHAKQLREILKTGNTPTVSDNEEDAEEDDEDIVAAAVKNLTAKWKKKK